MMNRRLNCSVCQEEFTTMARNAKYCSEECRQEGSHQQRKEWESKTNYKEKQREAMREYRGAKAAEQFHVDLEARKHREKERKIKAQQRVNERQAELMARVKAARMYMAKPHSVEYWEAFRDYEIQSSLKYEKKLIWYVNGISVYDNDFVEKVIFMIEEQGVIFSELVSTENTN